MPCKNIRIEAKPIRNPFLVTKNPNPKPEISTKLNFFQYSMDPGTGHCSEETVGSLRQRLNVMREIVKVH